VKDREAIRVDRRRGVRPDLDPEHLRPQAVRDRIAVGHRGDRVGAHEDGPVRDECPRDRAGDDIRERHDAELARDRAGGDAAALVSQVGGRRGGVIDRGRGTPVGRDRPVRPAVPAGQHERALGLDDRPLVAGDLPRRGHRARGRDQRQRVIAAARRLDDQPDPPDPAVVVGADVHRGERGGGGPEHRDRQRLGPVGGGVVADDRAAGALHREHDVPRIGDRRGEGPVLAGIGRLVIEPDIEGDGARLQRLQGTEQIDVGLARKGIPAIAGDRRVIDRDDRHEIAEPPGRPGDEGVVGDALEARIQEADREGEPAGEHAHDHDPGENGALAQPPGDEHVAPHPARVPARSSTPRRTPIARA